MTKAGPFYESIVCFSDPKTAAYFTTDPRFVGLRRFYAEDGGALLQGRRLNMVWVHWSAPDQGEKYFDMIATILSSIAMNPQDMQKQPMIF